MFGHAKHLLSAYCHGQLSPDESCWVARHLRECVRCRMEYESVRLGVDLAEQIGAEPAPESLWSEIEAALDNPAQLPAAPRPRSGLWEWLGFRPAWPAVAGALATLVLGVWVGQILTRPDATGEVAAADPLGRNIPPLPQFSLAGILDPVQAAPRAESISAITTAPPEFQPCGKEQLTSLGLARVLEDRPLPGFDLLEQRIHDYRGLPVTQFVYSSEAGQAFSVFVAPRKVRFSFGNEYLVDTTVDGIRCRKVDCPYQRTYEFEGANRFVLVSKALDEQRSAQVMRHFLKAEQDAH